MALLVRTEERLSLRTLEDVVKVASTHMVTLPDVGTVHRVALEAGETGEVIRLDNHITIQRAGAPNLYSWHEGKALAPAQTRNGLVHVRPAQEAHSSVWDAPCELSIVALTPWFVSHCAADLFKKDLSRTRLRSSIAGSDPFLWCLGMKLDELARQPDPPLVFMDQIATSMAMHLLLTAGVEPASFVARALSRAAVRRVNQYVDAHLASEIRLADLASLCDLSLFHFSRQFKRETGMSPARFVRFRRMETARRLLTETGLGIDQIAVAVGYQDASAFRRAFISEQGMSPSRFRRSVNG